MNDCYDCRADNSRDGVGPHKIALERGIAAGRLPSTASDESNEEDQASNQHAVSRALPNGSRLSCAAEVGHSQMEFFTTCAGGASFSRWLGSRP